MPLIPIDLPPGVFRNGTDLQSQGRYRDADLVRFADGTLQPVKGWRTKSEGSVYGKARAMTVWRDNDGTAWVAIGTHARLYAMDRAGVLHDITPIRATASLTDPFATVLDSRVITVTDAGHGALAGDSVIFSGATTVGGLMLDRTFVIVEVLDADSYTVEVGEDETPADATAGGGGAVTAKYQISPGEFESTLQGGYGNDVYGAGAYGTPRPETDTPTDVTVWSLDTWGETLVACQNDNGVLYEWALDTTAPAVPIAGAPTARGLHVTADRILMALGANGNPRKVQWSDQEDNTAWAPATDNYAGDFDLQTAGRLMCAGKVAGGSLLLTDADAHRARFLGQPLVYGFDKVGAGCGAVSQRALCVVDGRAYWMGQRSFWIYNNYVETLPSEVADYVFSDINRGQIQKVSAWHNADYGEIWWFYPSGSSGEIDRYVAYSYRENHWTIGGGLKRLSGSEKGPLAFPLAVDDAGVVYEQEVGSQYGGAAPFAESSDFSIGEGDRVVSVCRVIPDERKSGDVEMSIFVRDRPMGVETAKGPFVLDDQVDVRFTGRLMRVRYTGAKPVDWRVGRFKLDGTVGGMR